MSLIKSIHAREILDSRGNPALEVTVAANNSTGIVSIPSGSSKGKYEALELRDRGKRFNGLGLQKAIKNIEKIIAPRLIGKKVQNQKEIDGLMIKLDGTKNKSKLGANSILGVSLACAKAASESKNLPLYQYLHQLYPAKIILPQAFFNVINGGKHADNELSIQEFMIVPHYKSIKGNTRVASEIYHILKQELSLMGSTNVGDEGGFAPNKLTKTEEVLDLLVKVIKKAKYLGKVNLALDCAASEFFRQGKYLVDGKKLSTEELTQFYLKLIQKYHLISIEDPFHQDDFKAFNKLKRKTKIQIVGDDLTVTSPPRIKIAIKEKSINCLLLKVNQIGTLTEALEAANLAFKQGWKVMVSHRSGETEDTFIADLAVALGCGMIKAGAPCRGERTAKYNRLLRIEEELQTLA